MATIQLSKEKLALAEASDNKISTTPAVEESQVRDRTKDNGTTIQREFEYVAGWKLHFITLGYFFSRRCLRDALNG